MKETFIVRPLARACHKATWLRRDRRTIEIVVYRTVAGMRRALRDRKILGQTEALSPGDCVARVTLNLEDSHIGVVAHEAYHCALRFRESLRLPATKSWKVKEERIAYLVDNICWALHDCLGRARRRMRRRTK